MNLPSTWKQYSGAWSGSTRLWLSPAEPVRESAATATVTLAARGTFVVLTYAWSDQGEPHDGVLIVRTAEKPSPVDMVWVDSFHTAGGFIQFSGEEAAEGRISALASYPAPSGPDWGWRIVLAADPTRGLQVRMYNIPPGGEDLLAVETTYVRATAAS